MSILCIFILTNTSIEHNDNRLARYSGQNGCCFITETPLTIGDIECHHKKTIKDGGEDTYRNLCLVTKDIHKLIHVTDRFQARHYYNKVKGNLDEKSLSKLNKLRIKAGNEHIKLF